MLYEVITPDMEVILHTTDRGIVHEFQGRRNDPGADHLGDGFPRRLDVGENGQHGALGFRQGQKTKGT